MLDGGLVEDGEDLPRDGGGDGKLIIGVGVCCVEVDVKGFD